MFESCRDRQRPSLCRLNENLIPPARPVYSQGQSPFQDDPGFEQHQRQTAAWTAIWASADAAVSNFDVMPRRPSRLASRSVCGFLVVSMTSPMKMELAPATKHSA